MMLSRRNLLQKSFSSALLGLIAGLVPVWKWVSGTWAQIRQLLPRGFPREKIAGMNPAEIDSRNLEIDPLDRFGTMGPTDLSIDRSTFRLKVTGEVDRPLSLTYDEILLLPSTTEDVLLICPGFFSNHGRWTGVSLKDLLETARPRKEAAFVEIKGHKKALKVAIETTYRKKIFLAYLVNSQTLPRKHGFPLRLVYADVYGDDWIKYVEEVAVLPMPKPGS